MQEIVEHLIFSYTIRGGTLLDISINEEIFGLVIKIDASDEGKLVLDLPRKYIDAEKQNGKDEVFIILVEKQNEGIIETTYEESISNSNVRTITINFEEGDSQIQIIGTYVIPEFGTIGNGSSNNGGNNGVYFDNKK